MSHLFDRIRAAVEAGRYVITLHAAQRLRERRVPQWQAISGLRDATLLLERPRARPNPCIEVEQWLADGTPVKAVWAWLPYDQAAQLVTLHYLNR